MKDKSGREVKVGDFIVYGHALGRCAGLQYGKVLELRRVKKNSWDDEDDEKIDKLQVQSVGWDWSEKPYLQKPSVLAFPERILVVNEEQVHPRVLALLKG